MSQKKVVAVRRGDDEQSRRKTELIRVNIAEQIRKEYKDNPSYIYYGDSARMPTLRQVIPTGLPNLDVVMAKDSKGDWGLPCGRIMYLYGKEKCGKTTLALHIAKIVQQSGGIVFFVESEHALDSQYAETLGVNTKELLLSQPDTLEDCFNVILSAVKTVIKFRKQHGDDNNVWIVIIVDSISGFPTKAEVESNFEKRHVGEHARIISEACRRLTSRMSKLNVLLLCVAQEREKIGVTYGDASTFIGGRALRFHASIGLRINRIANLKAGEEPYGIRSRVRVVHNKCRPPLKDVDLDIIWSKGIDQINAIHEALEDNKAIKKKGAWKTWIDRNKQKHVWQTLDEFASLLENTRYRKQLMDKAYGK